MTKTGLAILTLMAAMSWTAPAEAQPQHEVVAAYLRIQAALANDTLDGVAPAAKLVTEEAGTIGAAGEPAARAAKAVGAAKDLKAARAAFGPLSDAVIAIVKADPGPHDVKLAYCPMAKASWLQTEEKIRNPYYGSSMLSCGEFRPLK